MWKKILSRHYKRITDARDILDWLRAFEQTDTPESLDGSEANVIGFTYHDDQLDENQLWISRYVMVCCAADAFPIGMVVVWQDASELDIDVWVQVRWQYQDYYNR